MYMNHTDFEMPSNIQEISFDEIDEVNGGLGPLAIVAIAAVVVVGAAFVAGVVDGASGNEKQTD
jgi:lactobin A/cerein 7B family class IIb bacteriocin